MRILIVRFSSLGDVILASCVFSFLKTYVHDCELCFITLPCYVELFRDDPRLSGVFGIPRNGTHEIAASLAKQHWDLIVDLQHSTRSKGLIKKHFSSVPCGVFDKLHVNRFLLLFFGIDRYDREQSAVARYINATGFNPQSGRNIPSVKLYFKGNGLGEKILFPEAGDGARPVMAFFPFSAWKNKEWPLHSFAEVGKHFCKKNWKVALLGGAEEIYQADTLQGMIGDGCISLVGKLSLYENGSLLKKCSLALGNDTGLSHLARACGVKTGVIYGATTWHFGFFPQGEPPYAVFEAPEFCRPCHPHGGRVCWRLSRPCLKHVTVQSVIDGLERLSMMK